MKYINVADSEGYEILLPLRDGKLSLETLRFHFPRAYNLRFKNEEGKWMGLDIEKGKLFPPDNEWGERTYYCSYPGVSRC